MGDWLLRVLAEQALMAAEKLERLRLAPQPDLVDDVDVSLGEILPAAYWGPDRETPPTAAEMQEMLKEHKVTLHVTLQDVSTPREPVDRTLEQIIKTVANVIPRFDPFLT